jgi:hypothetical protein
MLGREVVEGREVVPVAVEGLDRRLLASRVEPAGEFVPAQLALTPARRIPDLFQRPAGDTAAFVYKADGRSRSA